MVGKTAAAEKCLSFSFNFLGILCGVLLLTSPALAISASEVDDFQDGTLQGWEGAAVAALPDVGPAGTGDWALEVTTSGNPGGQTSRLVTFNGGDGDSPAATQWTGNWSGAGVSGLSIDVLNVNEFPLEVWIAIAGPQGPDYAGGTDSYVSKTSRTIPGDGLWHTVTFSTTAVDFDSWGYVDDPVTALTDVYQLRILHSPTQDFRGAKGAATMVLDNIRAIPESRSIPEPSCLTLSGFSLAYGLLVLRFRRWRADG